MNSVQGYEIFQKPHLKPPIRVETATSLEDAKNRLKELAQMFPADYFIFDCEASVFIIPFDGPLRHKDILDVFNRTAGIDESLTVSLEERR